MIMRIAWTSPILVLLGFSLGAPLLAQAQGTIVGTVVGTVADEVSGAALRGATVSLTGLDIRALTDGDGIFELVSVPAGSHAARVELPGYVTMVEQIEVLPDEVSLLQVQVRRVEVALQGLIVRSRGGEVQGASITDVGRGDRSRTALDLLREQVPGVMVRSSLGAQTGIRIRGSSSLMNNDPAIYLNGIRLSDAGGPSAIHALEQIPAERVQRIRVLRGPAAAARYGDSASGVILVETR